MKIKFLMFLILLPINGFTQESETPFLDSIREEIAEEDAKKSAKKESPNDGTYIKKLQEQIKKRDQEYTETYGAERKEGTYIESLKSEDPDYYQSQPASKGYTEILKGQIKAKETGGAIQAVSEGRSDLKLRREGEINNAIGVRMGASFARNITASSEHAGAAFTDVYGNGFTPDISGFYEWQPWHSEWFGNIGLFVSGGLSYYSGKGQFSVVLTNPQVAGENFGSESKTDFRFYAIPLSLGANYRFNLARLFRPYAAVAPTGIVYFETRGDDKAGNRGFSPAIHLSAGVAILLDWMSSSFAWDIYRDSGVLHYYLTIEYSRLMTFTGKVDYNVSGIYAGLTFEY